MYCLKCEHKPKLKETECYEYGNIFYQKYICPICGSEHECSSQSGDMEQIYLNLI
jgi:hypothetical protein